MCIYFIISAFAFVEGTNSVNKGINSFIFNPSDEPSLILFASLISRMYLIPKSES